MIDDDSPMARSPRRGQTTLDFAVGMGMFLVTVVFVISYAPTMFDPFAGDAGTQLVVADRAATTLSDDVLAASTAEPGVLSLGCVAEFFDESIDDDGCSTEGDLDNDDILPAVEHRSYNITIHDLDTSADDPAAPESVGETELTRSRAGSIQTDVAVATRTVSIDGEPYRLTVRVW